jgi:hypothetical protein
MSQAPALTASPLLDHRFPLPLDRPFTSSQAHVAGIDKRALARLVESALIRRVLRGVYVAAQVPESHDLRTRALSLVTPPGSVVTDWSACWLWTGVHRPNAHLERTPVSVFRWSGAGRLRNPQVMSGERLFVPDDIAPLTERLWVTTPLRTAWDLGRFSPAIVALGGIDALLRDGAFSKDELVAGVERLRRQRGVVQLRWLVPMADRRAESCGESGLRFHWHQCPDLPPPELQIPVLRDDGSELFRIDLGVEELSFGAEYDGERWHDADSALTDEVRRARLQQDFGWLIEVFRRGDVYGPAADAGVKLRRAIRVARSRLGAPSAFD